MHLVILDLDETLIHSCDEWIGHPHDFIAASKMIFVRPYAKEFVEELLLKYKVAVWTASYGKYTEEIIKYLFRDKNKLEFVFDRSHCSLTETAKGQDVLIKDLEKIHEIGWTKNSFSIVDDKPECIYGERHQVIEVKPYFGSDNDKELLNILKRIDNSIDA